MATRLTGKKYFYVGPDLKGRVVNFGNLEWSKENADHFFGEVLTDSGYARIKTPEKDTYQLINARDIRYTSNLPSYTASRMTNDLPVPNSADWAELIYHSKNGALRVSNLARNLRPFMSRYGRVVDDRVSGLLIIRDNLANIHQLLPLIRRMDVDVTKEELKEIERQNSMEILREKTRQEMILKMKDLMNKRMPERSTESKTSGSP